MKFYIQTFLTCLLASSLFFLVSCSSKQTDTKDSISEIETITIQTLSVLPVEIPDINTDIGYETKKQLEEGATALTEIIKNYLQDKKSATYLSSGQVESLLGNFQGNKREAAKLIGKKLGVDAILTPTLTRYINRVGKTYSVSQPASVAFDYSLMHVPTGRVLCTGTFDETQEGLFSNLFSFKKVAARGFKFITAEELTIEGVKEKFDNCKYLTQ